MVEIRYVQESDREFWFRLDQHICATEFSKKVRDRMGYVLLSGGIPVGLLRYNLFWDNTPFCTMLFVDWDYQGEGFGRALMAYWEADMKEAGYGLVMTSTQADESAQHFYRKLGYIDAGGLTMPVPGYEQPLEILMVKKI